MSKDLEVTIEIPIKACSQISPQAMATYTLLSVLVDKGNGIKPDEAILMVEQYYGVATCNAAVAELNQHGYVKIEE